MKIFTIFVIILFNLSVLNLQSQNLPKLVDMSDKIPIAGTLVTLSDVQVVGNTLWINSSSSAVILRSTDGGRTFTSPTTVSATQALFMFSDATNGWAVGGAKGNKQFHFQVQPVPIHGAGCTSQNRKIVYLM